MFLRRNALGNRHGTLCITHILIWDNKIEWEIHRDVWRRTFPFHRESVVACGCHCEYSVVLDFFGELIYLSSLYFNTGIEIECLVFIWLCEKELIGTRFQIDSNSTSRCAVILQFGVLPVT